MSTLNVTTVFIDIPFRISRQWKVFGRTFHVARVPNPSRWNKEGGWASNADNPAVPRNGLTMLTLLSITYRLLKVQQGESK